jgi:hypothetical protein
VTPYIGGHEEVGKMGIERKRVKEKEVSQIHPFEATLKKDIWENVKYNQNSLRSGESLVAHINILRQANSEFKVDIDKDSLC